MLNNLFRAYITKHKLAAEENKNEDEEDFTPVMSYEQCKIILSMVDGLEKVSYRKQLK